MKFGDTVKVTNGSLKSYGKQGTVESVVDNGNYVAVKVAFKGSQPTTTFNEKSLAVVVDNKPESHNGFFVGDRVVVDNYFLQSHGRHGVVVDLNGSFVLVEWDKPKLIFKYKPCNLKREFSTGDVVTINGTGYVIQSIGKQKHIWEILKHTCYNPNTNETVLYPVDGIQPTGKRFNVSLKLGGMARVVRGKTEYFNHVGVITSVDLMAGTVTMTMPDDTSQVFNYEDVNPSITEKAHHTVKFGDNVVITKRNSPSYGKMGVVEKVQRTTALIKFSDGTREIFSDTNVSLVPDTLNQGKFDSYQIGDTVEVIGYDCKMLGRQGKVTGFSPNTNEIWIKIEGIVAHCRYALRKVKKVASVQPPVQMQANFTAVLLSGVFDDLGSATFVEMFNESSREELDQSIINKIRETGDFYYWVLYTNCSDVREPIPVKVTEKLEVRGK